MFRHEVIFSAGDRNFTVGDALDFARQTGKLENLRQGLTLALASQEHARTNNQEMDLLLLQERSDRYRKEHGLLGPWETIAWLKRAGLDLEELQAFLVRRHWLQELGGSDAVLNDQTRPEPKKVEDLLFGEIYLGGHLAELINDLALAAAATAEKGDIPSDLGMRELAPALQSALRRERENSLAESRLVNRLRMEAASLLRFTGLALICPHKGAASEALVCLQEDGESPQDLAERAGLTLAAFSRLAVDQPAEVREALLSAVESEVVGPFEADGKHLLLILESKTPPSLNDPDIRQRLGQAILNETHEAILERQVRMSKLGEELIN